MTNRRPSISRKSAMRTVVKRLSLLISRIVISRASGKSEVLEVQSPRANEKASCAKRRSYLSYRAAALAGIPKVPGMHLDEAPPAVFRNPGDPVLVTPTPPRDNTGAGASLGNQARSVPNGGQVIIQIKRA